MSRKKIKKFINKKTPQNGGTAGRLVKWGRKADQCVFCKEWYNMGKIPMQEKSAQRGQKNNPINCSGYTPGIKKPPLKFCGGLILFGIYQDLPPLQDNSHNPKHHGNKSNCSDKPILPTNHAVASISLKEASSRADRSQKSSRPKSL